MWVSRSLTGKRESSAFTVPASIWLMSSNVLSIPVIASGGCGTVGHFVRVFQETGCDAALAASIFHYGDLTVNTVKNALKERGISVKLKEKGACA